MTLLLSNYQACSPYLTNNSEQNFVDAQLSVNVSSAEEDFVKGGYIDVLDYMNSANIQGGQENYVHFRHQATVDGIEVISATKFNDSSNVEIFTGDNNFVYVRYEATPETYGGMQNSVRRFQGVPVKSPHKNISTHLGEPNMGAIWSPRFITRESLNRPILVAHSIDSFQYGKNGIKPGAISSKFQDMYIWVDVKHVSEKVSYVSSEHQPQDKLIISQQWSDCNVEQYEYAKGVGYVGWRSLISKNPECGGHKRTSSETVSLQNYARPGAPMENYIVERGQKLNDPMHLYSFDQAFEPSFEVGEIFLDDLPYTNTSPTPLLDVLRKAPARTNYNNNSESQGSGAAAGNNTTTRSNDHQETTGTVDSRETKVVGRSVDEVDVEVEIEKIFQELLGRSADSSGFQFYLAAQEKGRSLNQIRNDIRQSNEYMVRQLYLTHLLREPEIPGLKFYRDYLDKGTSFAVIRADIQKSGECKVDCL